MRVPGWVGILGQGEEERDGEQAVLLAFGGTRDHLSSEPRDSVEEARLQPSWTVVDQQG